jgi:hypothetical protein
MANSERGKSRFATRASFSPLARLQQHSSGRRQHVRNASSGQHLGRLGDESQPLVTMGTMGSGCTHYLTMGPWQTMRQWDDSEVTRLGL